MKLGGSVSKKESTIMKHFKKILALTLALIMCFGITTMSASAAESNIASTQSETVGSIVISNTSTGRISASGSKSMTLSDTATSFAYWVLPDTENGGSTSGTIKVTFRNSLGEQTHYLKRDGVIHTVNLNSYNHIGKGPLTVTWSGATKIHFISISFGG